jgi:glycosyltransferase involved in cell wall biosynthesis
MAKFQAVGGNTVTIYTMNQKKLPVKEFIEGYHVERFRSVLTIYNNSISLEMIPALLKSRKKFDVIHAHSHLFYSTNACTAIRLLGSAPLVITNHGLLAASVPEWMNKFYKRCITPIIYDLADHIICFTDIEKINLTELGIDKGKISVIHNGIDTSHFYPDPSLKKEVPPQILWIGRFVPGKGIEYLIDAFSLVQEKQRDVQLVLVGDGPRKNYIKDMITKKGLTSKVRIIDFIENIRLFELYNRSKIFVLPSLMEGVPRTLLEAMACGIPVIVTKLPHLERIIHGSGYTIPPKDPVSLAEKINLILDNDGLASELGSNGIKVIERNYSWQDTQQKTLDVYQKLCKQKNFK